MVHDTLAVEQESSLSYQERRNAYWAMLRSAYNDYIADSTDPNFADFNKVMANRYGIRVNMVGGNIDSSFQILDEKKYTLFLLKYSR